jgi:hypothetical protein
MDSEADYSQTDNYLTVFSMRGDYPKRYEFLKFFWMSISVLERKGSLSTGSPKFYCN